MTDKRPLGWNLPAAHARLRESGRYPGGAIPFGYVLASGSLVKDPEQQAAIRRMHALRNYGMSFRSIARTMAEEGFVVSHNTVRSILHRTEGGTS